MPSNQPNGYRRILVGEILQQNIGCDACRDKGGKVTTLVLNGEPDVTKQDREFAEALDDSILRFLRSSFTCQRFPSITGQPVDGIPHVDLCISCVEKAGYTPRSKCDIFDLIDTREMYEHSSEYYEQRETVLPLMRQHYASLHTDEEKQEFKDVIARLGVDSDAIGQL